MRWVIVAAATALLAVPGAGAAPWKQVTASGGGSTDQVGVLRTADGVLHLAWRKRTGPNTEDLLHTAIGPGGAVGATSPIQTGWAVLQNPALVAVPGGIQVFFGGIRTTDPSETNKELNAALSIDGGAGWALTSGSIVPLGAQAYGSPVAATVLPGGTTLQAWAGSLGTWVHAGLSPASANHDFQAPLGTYGYDPGLATRADGSTVMAWYSNAAGHLGVKAQGVAADGSPVGVATTMPGTAAMQVGMIGRTPIVVRGGDFWIAYATGYPSLNRIRVWKVGAGSAQQVGQAPTTGNTSATLAVTSGGRLWVAWVEHRGGVPRVVARRSNPAATRFGEPVVAGRPANGSSAYHLSSSASGGALDVLATFTIGVTPGAATYYRRILPGLTLAASRTRIPRSRTARVTFTVTDAGAPVAGALVAGGGDSGRTNASGKVTLALKSGRRTFGVTAGKSGYTNDAITIRTRA